VPSVKSALATHSSQCAKSLTRRRAHGGISLLAARHRYTTTDGWQVEEASFAYGGMAPTTVTARKTATYLKGKRWCQETLQGAYDALANVSVVKYPLQGGLRLAEQRVLRQC
jgi:xanthine dehydrogenase/oxidase